MIFKINIWKFEALDPNILLVILNPTTLILLFHFSSALLLTDWFPRALQPHLAPTTLSYSTFPVGRADGSCTSPPCSLPLFMSPLHLQEEMRNRTLAACAKIIANSYLYPPAPRPRTWTTVWFWKNTLAVLCLSKASGYYWNNCSLRENLSNHP